MTACSRIVNGFLSLLFKNISRWNILKHGIFPSHLHPISELQNFCELGNNVKVFKWWFCNSIKQIQNLHSLVCKWKTIQDWVKLLTKWYEEDVVLMRRNFWDFFSSHPILSYSTKTELLTYLLIINMLPVYFVTWFDSNISTHKQSGAQNCIILTWWVFPKCTIGLEKHNAIYRWWIIEMYLKSI